MTEFEIAGVQYRASPMGARDDYSVCRRLTGLLKNIDMDSLRGADGGMAMGLAIAAYAGDMPQDDVDYIFDKVLPKVQRNINGVWMAFAAQNGALMDNSIDMATLVAVMRNVLTPLVMSFLRSTMPELFSPPPAAASATTSSTSPAATTGS